MSNLELEEEEEEEPVAGLQPAPYAMQQPPIGQPSPVAGGAWGSTPLSLVPEQSVAGQDSSVVVSGPYGSISSTSYSPTSSARNPVVKKSWFSSLFSKSPRRKRGSSAAALSGVGGPQQQQQQDPGVQSGLVQATPPRSRGSSGSGHSSAVQEEGMLGFVGGPPAGGMGSPASSHHRPGVVAMLSPKDTKVLSTDIDLVLQQLPEISFKSRKRGMVFEVLHREEPKLRLKIRISKDSKNLSSVVFKHKAGDFHQSRAIIETVRQSIGI